MKPSRTPTAIRLPVALHERLRDFASTQDISVSAAMRIALNRGLAAMEMDAARREVAAERPVVEAPRRRVLSPGVGG